jgi:hypothetical protein
MSQRWNLDRDHVIHAIFMEMPGRDYDRSEEDRRTAERIYDRVFEPLLTFGEGALGPDAQTVAAQMKSHECPICGLPLDDNGCCIAMCGSSNYTSKTQGKTDNDQ